MSVVQMGPMPPPHGGVSMNMLSIHQALKEGGHGSRIIDITNRKGENNSREVLKPRSALGLIKLLATLDCDILHYHIGGDFTLKLAVLTLICGWLPRKRSVVTFHSGGYAQEFSDRARARSFRGIAFRSVDLLIGVNDPMIRMFRSYGVDRNRVRLIPPFELKRPDPAIQLPADLEAFAARYDPLLLSIGALEREYGNEFLVNSMHRVLERFQNAGLMIIGSGSLEPELRRSIISSGLGNRIHLAGNIDHDIVLKLVERADAVLRITDFDGDSIAVREALFIGTPVIASDNANRPEGAYLLPMPFSSADLVEKLVQAEEGQFSDQTIPIDAEGNASRVLEAYEELLAS